MSLFGRDSDLPKSSEPILPAEEDAVLEKVATKVVARGMAVPAILFLESVKPLNYIGSQAMVFFEPIVQTIFNFKEYDTFRSALEKRESIEILLQKIEAQDAVALKREKKIKVFLKEEKKKWKWYQRWLGIFTPKVNYPDDIMNDTPPPPKDKSK